tara:strand:+ start:128 stop:439 length:312 start_codon:yes stop_codon:yes gene_type:complete
VRWRVWVKKDDVVEVWLPTMHVSHFKCIAEEELHMWSDGGNDFDDVTHKLKIESSNDEPSVVYTGYDATVEEHENAPSSEIDLSEWDDHRYTNDEVLAMNGKR